MTTRLEAFRNHARAMAEADHKPECIWSKPREAEQLTKRRPIWQPYGGADGCPVGMALVGWSEPIERCAGCVSGDERALWRRLAGEVDDYLDGQLGAK